MKGRGVQLVPPQPLQLHLKRPLLAVHHADAVAGDNVTFCDCATAARAPDDVGGVELVLAGQLLAPPCANEARPRQPQRLPRACTVVYITNRISVAFCRQHAPAGWRNACWYLQRAIVTRNVRRGKGGGHMSSGMILSVLMLKVYALPSLLTSISTPAPPTVTRGRSQLLLACAHRRSLLGRARTAARG
jgi:hypothetical protein